MKLFGVRNLLTFGLAVKLSALALALILAGPAQVPGPALVQAKEKQEETAKDAEQTDKELAEEGGGEAMGETAPTTPAAPAAPQYDPALMRLLEQKRDELAQQEERIAQERRDLENLRGEVNQRISELKKVQMALEELVSAEKQQRRKRIQQLVKVLGNMRGEAAAAVVEKLDDQMAVEIFKLMNSRTAGKVMAALKPTNAARISALLAREQKSKDAAKLAGQAAASGAQPPPPPTQPKPGQKKPAKPK